MLKKIYNLVSIAVASFIWMYPQLSLADGYTSAQFLENPEMEQNSFIEISITMMGIVIAQSNEETARCIDSWYTTDPTVRHERNGQIREAMNQFSEFHPQGVILAVVNRACPPG